MKQDGIGRETNHKRLLISQNRVRGAGGSREGGGVMDIGEDVCYGKCCKCVNLVIHRPVPLGIKIYVYKK